ncbi:MAG: hypothetical protein KIT70_10265 [Anaerolineales bacterium]|nr:MAG: hypothetical protein KIT70_10265 [Anaerolineales bacterium]
MITPAGRECRHFHGDYFRGRNIERCRLLDAYRLPWTPDLCTDCPVPEILAANACEHQSLVPRIHKPLFFMKPAVQVTAECSQCQCTVEEPRIGCGQCHPLPGVFVVGPE